MKTKLLTACMALVAFAALAIGPATASATNSPLLTLPTGTVAALGTKIEGTAGVTKLTNTSGGTTLECVSATMTGEITKNTTGSVEGTITSATFVGSTEPVGGEPDKACEGFASASVTAITPWCLRSTSAMATDEFQVRGGKCSEAAKKIEFKMVTSLTTCSYERAATSPVTGTFTTHPTAAKLSVTSNAAGSGFTGAAGNSFICPTSGFLDMEFSLTSDDGKATPAFIDS